MTFEAIASPIALLFSLIALVVSALSYFGTQATRRREWRIEAGKVAAEASRALDSVAARTQKTKASWHAMFAARGTYKSGMRQAFDAEMDRKNVDAATLTSRISTITDDMEKKNDQQLEETIVTLRGYQIQTQEIVNWLDQKDAEHMNAVAERRRAVGIS